MTDEQIAAALNAWYGTGQPRPFNQWPPYARNAMRAAFDAAAKAAPPNVFPAEYTLDFSEFDDLHEVEP
jgi:hypothetical protein